MSDERLTLEQPLLSYAGAAELLGVPESTLRQWAREGRVPVLRLGPRAHRFTRPMLEDWLRSTYEEQRRFT